MEAIARNKRFFQGTCYQVNGDADGLPVLVLLHGVGLNQDLWDYWAERLSCDYTILRYDFLGHGGSANPSGPRSLQDFCDQLSSLVEHLDFRRCHIAGFSLGALVALLWASQNPQRLLSLTLLHSVYQRSPDQLSAIRQRYAMTRDEGPMATVEVAIRRWFSPSWIQQNPDYIDSIRRIFRDHKDDGSLKAEGVFCEADADVAAADLSAIQCPCLAITGSLEPGSTPAMSEALGRRLGAKVIINEGHLHMAPVEHADQLIAQVKQFIESTT